MHARRLSALIALLLLCVGCGLQTSDLIVSGPRAAAGAKLLLDDRQVGVMSVSDSSADPVWPAWKMRTIARGHHQLTIEFADGTRLAHPLLPGEYVYVWIRAESLEVESNPY